MTRILHPPRDVKDIPNKPYCGSYAWLNKETDQTSVFFCGLASCGRAYCQKLYYLKRVCLISDLILEHGLTRFFTLTMDRKMARREAWEKVPYVWDKARKRIIRRHPNLRYCAILEAHKDGYPHIHGFMSEFVDQRVWSSAFAGSGGGSYVWIEEVKVKTGDVARYVSKQLNVARYVGKVQVITARQMIKPRARTFWRSKGMKTEYEERQKAAKSPLVLVPELIYMETEKGFDKCASIVYSECMKCYYVVSKHPSIGSYYLKGDRYGKA